MTFFNPVLKNLKPYIGGKAIEELKRESGLKEQDIVKLASNENPLGPSPKALTAIKRASADINRYPDSNYFNLRSKLATRLKLGMDNIVLGNGSDELIDCVIKSFSAPGDEILSAKTTFLEYEIIARVNGRKFKAVNLNSFRYDLDALAKAITNKTKLIFIANPNNPTGTYVNRDEVERFLKAIPKRIIVIFDEAYNEFIDVRDFPCTSNYFKKFNVIILRTFSKAYGLAGLRIGFAISASRFAVIMNKVREPFNVNSLASAAAMAAIDDKPFVKRTTNLIWKEKKFLYNSLKRLNIDYIPSVTNFILLDMKSNAKSVFASLLKKGVIIRPMNAYGLKNFIRITIGRHGENEKFIYALKELL